MPPAHIWSPVEPGRGVARHQPGMRLMQRFLRRFAADAVHQQLGDAVEHDRLMFDGIPGLRHGLPRDRLLAACASGGSPAEVAAGVVQDASPVSAADHTIAVLVGTEAGHARAA